VIAIDANINAINTLKENCTQNNFNHIKLLNNAVSDNDETYIDFNLNIKNPNESSIEDIAKNDFVVH
jgi:FkbM family methyltransferase